MPRGRRTRREYQAALDSAIFGRYEAEVFTDVWNELVEAREEIERLRAELAEIQADMLAGSMADSLPPN